VPSSAVYDVPSGRQYSVRSVNSSTSTEHVTDRRRHGRRAGDEHVETYWAGGRTGITVSVRRQPTHRTQHHHHQQQQQQLQQQQRRQCDAVVGQLSEYDTLLLDDAAAVAIATQHPHNKVAPPPPPLSRLSLCVGVCQLIADVEYLTMM